MVGLVLVLLFLNRFFGLPLGPLRAVDSLKANLYGYLIILLLAFFMALYFQGSFLQVILSYIAVLGLGLALVVLTVLAAISFNKKEPLAFAVKRGLILTGVCLASHALSYGLGYGIYVMRGNITRDYAARIIVILEHTKAREGTYPKTLPSSVPDESWLGYKCFYSSDGVTYRFSYDDVAGVMDIYELNSVERVWQHIST